MLGYSPNQNLGNLFCTPLKLLLNPDHPLLLLAEEIDWSVFEQSFSPLHSSKGHPSHPIHLMKNPLIINRLQNVGDETVVQKWIKNPYYQYFCGIDVFQWQLPTATSDLVHSRHRIGEKGVELIMQVSVLIHGKKAEISIDTTF